MASTQNLEILVDVDIGSAIANLSLLQAKLTGLASDIEQVDAIGTEGINIKTRVDSITDDLAKLKAQKEAFEQSEKLTISTALRQHRGSVTGAAAQQTIRAGGGFGPNILQDDDGESLVSKLSGVFDKLKSPMDEFDIRMTDMHNALAKLVPLIIVLVGAIPALYTAVIGLAAAAASAAAALFALGGFGALGVAMQGGEFDSARLMDVLRELRDEFLAAFAPLAESLEPLFMDAVDGLTMLFNEIAQQGDALMQLTDDARAFGDFVLSFVPSALRSMAAMVETMRPVFSMLASAVSGTSILRTLTELTLDVIPSVMMMVSAFFDLLPALVELSAGFAIVAAGMFRVLQFVGKLVSILPISAEAMGVLLGATLAAASAFAILNGAIVSTAATALLKLGAAIQAQIVQLVGYKAATISATLATYGLTNAIRALLAVTVIGLVLAGLSVAVGSMGSAFRSTESDIRSTTDALREFDQVAGRTEGGFNPYSGSKAPVGGATATTSSGNEYILAGTDRDNRSNLKNAQWREGTTTYQGGP